MRAVLRSQLSRRAVLYRIPLPDTGFISEVLEFNIESKDVERDSCQYFSMATQSHTSPF